MIPPAWQDVWISPDDRGHIQAVGVDARERRQYIYHDEWRARRDREKFDRLPEFASKVGKVRKALEAELALKGLVQARVMACAIRLLDIGMFRVGGEDYAEENASYGLATLQKRHVRVKKGAIEFDYVAKSKVNRQQTVEDPLVVPTVVALKRRKGKETDELLAYREGRGAYVDVTSDDINNFVKSHVGEQFSAKDFRTWNGTVLAAVRLAGRHDATDRDKAVTAAIEEVAEILGNTPAVCRASYVDPRVIAQFEKGVTIRKELDRLAAKGTKSDFADRGGMERAVVKLIT